MRLSKCMQFRKKKIHLKYNLANHNHIQIFRCTGNARFFKIMNKKLHFILHFIIPKNRSLSMYLIDHGTDLKNAYLFRHSSSYNMNHITYFNGHLPNMMLHFMVILILSISFQWSKQKILIQEL